MSANRGEPNADVQRREVISLLGSAGLNDRCEGVNRLMHTGIGSDLGAVERYVTKLHKPRRPAQLSALARADRF
jgi:hypothetical protein